MTAWLLNHPWLVLFALFIAASVLLGLAALVTAPRIDDSQREEVIGLNGERFPVRRRARETARADKSEARARRR